MRAGCLAADAGSPSAWCGVAWAGLLASCKAQGPCPWLIAIRGPWASELDSYKFGTIIVRTSSVNDALSHQLTPGFDDDDQDDAGVYKRPYIFTSSVPARWFVGHECLVHGIDGGQPLRLEGVV